MSYNGPPSNYVPTVFTSDSKIINGNKYSGDLVYHGKKAPDCKPEALVLEFWSRLERAPKMVIDIHMTCMVLIEIRTVGFGGGALVNVETEKHLEPPYVLEPGQYHLRAVGPSDGNK